MSQPDYDYYRQCLKGQRLPLAFVDLDLLQENIAQILMRAGDMPIRIASKSVRCIGLLRRLLNASPRFQGLMCFSGEEAVALSQAGFDDLLVAYPVLQPSILQAMCKEVAKGKRLIAMVDSAEHVDVLARVARGAATTVPLCIDLDLSNRLPGLHFGVHRSSVQSPEQALALYQHILRYPQLELCGLMGYEAQLAGVPDQLPGQRLQNLAVSSLKWLMGPAILQRREHTVQALREAGAVLSLVNGGGTGSLEQTLDDPSVTELTVGSGFFNSHLFDYYRSFSHLPAAGFALEVVRRPDAQTLTCAGGGYVASGTPGVEKLPLPYLPRGLHYYPHEMAGEVQTPLLYQGLDCVELGDPILFRHAKAGELCERFNELVLVQSGRVVGREPTYRGMGWCFF